MSDPWGQPPQQPYPPQQQGWGPPPAQQQGYPAQQPYGAPGGYPPPPPANRYAWCVGGPVGPAYAFSNPSVANECASRVGAASADCRRAVRVGRCEVFNAWSIDTLNPGYCVCGGNGAYVGTWD